MYTASGSNTSYFTNGQPHHLDSFYPNDPLTSSQNEALMPTMTSQNSPKMKKKKKGCACSCCKCDLSSRSGHSLAAIFVNFLIAVIATVCLLVVISALIDQKSVDGFVHVLSLYSLCSWTTLCILIITVIVALFGLYADLTERKIPLKVFLVFAALVMIGFIFIAVVSLVARSQLKQSIHNSFNKTLTDSYGTDDDVTKALDKLHQRSKCCGTAHYSDWQHSTWLKEQTDLGSSNLQTTPGVIDQLGGDVKLIFAPDTCCKTVLANCGYLMHPNNLYERGCAQVIHEVYDTNLIKFAIICFVLAFFELFAFISSLYLLNRIRKQLVWQWY